MLTFGFVFVSGCYKDDDRTVSEPIRSKGLVCKHEVTFSDDGYWVINETKTEVKRIISNDGYWVINGLKTNVKAESAAGKSPKIGISDDGYWVIYGVKTDTKAAIYHVEAAIYFGTGVVYFLGDRYFEAVDCEIAYFGEVNGLGYVTEISQSDWTATAVAKVGSAYLVRLKDETYGRFYISGMTSRWSSSRPRITVYYVDVNYQYPFNL